MLIEQRTLSTVHRKRYISPFFGFLLEVNFLLERRNDNLGLFRIGGFDNLPKTKTKTRTRTFEGIYAVERFSFLKLNSLEQHFI